MPAPTTTTTDTTTTDPVAFVASVNETVEQVNSLLDSLSTMLCDRESVICIATDAVLADQTYQSVTTLEGSVTSIVARLTQVRELSQTIDRLADPMLMRDVN